MNKNSFLQFQKSQKLLYEYIDLKKIIWKLQDVDKIKNLFLNDSQRLFFDLIPKPNLNENLLPQQKSSFGIENIKRNKPKYFDPKHLLENYENMKISSSEIDKKIVSFFDATCIQNLIKKSKNNFDSIYNIIFL